MLSKNRWQVELFFKWIKQHLKIKCLRGTSENAVRIKINTAIFAYCLMTIVGYDLKIDLATYGILQVLGIFLLDKTPVNKLCSNIDYKDFNELDYNELLIREFKSDNSNFHLLSTISATF